MYVPRQAGALELPRAGAGALRVLRGGSRTLELLGGFADLLEHHGVVDGVVVAGELGLLLLEAAQPWQN